MKKLYILLACLLPVIGWAKVQFTIKGKIGALKAPAKMYLVYKDKQKDNIISSPIKNGEFLFKGDVEDFDMAMLCLDKEGKGESYVRSENNDHRIIYLENGVVEFKGVDSIATALLIQGKLTAEYETYRKASAPVEDKLNGLVKEFQANGAQIQSNPALLKEFQDRYNAIMSELRYNEYEFVTKNLSSPVSLRIVQGWMALPNYNVDVVLDIFNKLSPEVKNTSLGKATEQALKNALGTNVGSLAMDFEQNSPEGKPIKLSSFKGKYVLLDFWASWCGPCRGENPNVVNAYQKYKDKGFTVFGVSLDNNKSNWLKAISDDRLDWPHVSDLQGWQNGVAQQYKVTSIPQNFLIGPDGKIIAKNLRGADLEAKLREIFGM